MFHYRSEQWVPAPLGTVFDFFSDPFNLTPLMPPLLGVRIAKLDLVPPIPGSQKAGAGTRIAISARAVPGLPFRVRIEATIVEFESLSHFCDENTAFPFRWWKHCHRFAAEIRGGVEGTRVIDEVRYELRAPMNLPGVNAVAICPALAAMFRYRQSRLLELLGS